MSDRNPGPGWWQASDGKWYPPEQAAGAATPAPPAGPWAYQSPGPVAPPQGGYVPAQGMPGAPPPKKNNTLIIVLVVIGVVLLLGVGGCVALVSLARGTVEEGLQEFEETMDEFDRNNAEVVGSGEPGNTGTAEDPLALGTEVDLANGWRVTVNSADLDADAAVAAANEFNDPPASGMRFSVVNLTAAYDGNDEGTAEFPAIVTAVFGSDGVERNSFDSFATPPEPRFDSIGELLPGGEATGNLVFEVGEDETDLVMRIQPVFSLDSSEAWFSLEE